MSDNSTVDPPVAGSGSDGLEVAGEPGVYWCARHRKVKTRLRCGRCEKPICVKCTKFGPTGARCPACASFKGTHVYQVRPHQYLVAIAVALVLGMVSAFIAAFASFFALFYAPVAGTFIAKAVSAVTGHKRGTPLALITIGGLVIGVLASTVAGPLAAVMLAGALPPSALGFVLSSAASDLWVWLYLVLAIPSVWYWLKA